MFPEQSNVALYTHIYESLIMPYFDLRAAAARKIMTHMLLCSSHMSLWLQKMWNVELLTAFMCFIFLPWKLMVITVVVCFWRFLKKKIFNHSLVVSNIFCCCFLTVLWLFYCVYIWWFFLSSVLYFIKVFFFSSLYCQNNDVIK